MRHLHVLSKTYCKSRNFENPKKLQMPENSGILHFFRIFIFPVLSASKGQAKRFKFLIALIHHFHLYQKRNAYFLTDRKYRSSCLPPVLGSGIQTDFFASYTLAWSALHTARPQHLGDQSGVVLSTYGPIRD